MIKGARLLVIDKNMFPYNRTFPVSGTIQMGVNEAVFP